jgi:MSHA biogenesis protein MshJ
VNEALKRQLDLLVNSIESRSQAEKILVLGILLAGLVLGYLSLAYDPIRADISATRGQIGNIERQISVQQATFAAKLAQSQEDPNLFANDRLVVVTRELQLLETEIEQLGGDLVTPNEMTRILTEILARQAGLTLISFSNEPANPLREGSSDAAEVLAETGALNFDQVTQGDVTGQVYQHGLLMEFQGGFFDTLKYLRFLEEITGSFFWDAVTYKQLDWPNAQVILEIHTLSTDQGFIGV